MTLFSRVLWGVLFLLGCLSPGTLAQDIAASGAKVTETPLAQQVAALKKSYKEAQQQFYKLYAQAKSQKAKQQVFAKHYPKPKDYTARFMALAKQGLQTSAAEEALAWVVKNGRTGPEANEALELLTRYHLKSPAIASVCRSLGYSYSPKAEPFLRAVMAQNTQPEAKGQATYALASLLRRRGQTVRNLRKGGQQATSLRSYLVDSGGEAFAKQLEQKDPSALQTEAEKLLETVAANFSSVKSYRGTLADRAKKDLYEWRHLVAGKPAPDIVGEDIAGVPFKLSDYRGKVVVLDFWGYW